MPITKPRNRVVLFRITQEEFEQVQQACAESSARSVSDYARERILTARRPASASTKIETRLDELSRAVERLTSLVEARMRSNAA